MQYSDKFAFWYVKSVAYTANLSSGIDIGLFYLGDLAIG